MCTILCGRDTEVRRVVSSFLMVVRDSQYINEPRFQIALCFEET